MNYSRLQQLKDFTYYQFIVCDENDTYGHHLNNEYKTLTNALKKFDELVSSGLYTWICLRKNEIFQRNLPSLEISVSSLLKTWDKDLGICRNRLEAAL